VSSNDIWSSVIDRGSGANRQLAAVGTAADSGLLT
jgi:hypothetical protein